MKIYTGIAFGKKLEKIQELNLGLMLSSVYDLTIIKPEFKHYSCALDNGAFSDYVKNKNFPFDEHRFLQTLSKCIQLNINLDFIVCPDIVEGGIRSLYFSMKWAERLQSHNLALALQDGISPTDLINEGALSYFKVLFIGGSTLWKRAAIDEFTDFAHENNKLIHVGRIGKKSSLEFCRERKVDSVDSTSFARNSSWHILKEFHNPTQMKLI